MGGFFPKKTSHEETKAFFEQKNHEEVVLNKRANDQIVTMFDRSFINDKCIFQVGLI